MSSVAIRQERADDEWVELEVSSCEEITTPELRSINVRKIVGLMPSAEILKLSNRGNVRDPNNKQNKKIHMEIADTLNSRPKYLSSLHGGISGSAKEVELSKDKKRVRFRAASLLNGGNTQGVVKNTFAGNPNLQGEISYSFTIVDNDNLVAEMAVTHNTAAKVAWVSKAGKMGYLDDMSYVFQTQYRLENPTDTRTIRLEKSESDVIVSKENGNSDIIIRANRAIQCGFLGTSNLANIIPPAIMVGMKTITPGLIYNSLGDLLVIYERFAKYAMASGVKSKAMKSFRIFNENAYACWRMSQIFSDTLTFDHAKKDGTLAEHVCYLQNTLKTREVRNLEGTLLKVLPKHHTLQGGFVFPILYTMRWFLPTSRVGVPVYNMRYLDNARVSKLYRAEFERIFNTDTSINAVAKEGITYIALERMACVLAAKK